MSVNGVKRVLVGLLAVTLVVSVLACGRESQPWEEATGKPAATPTATLAPEQAKIFQVESYGAKGDGVTNDGEAISKAVAAAIADPAPEKVVQFQANKTYRVTGVPETNENNRLFDLQKANNVHIQGDNTKILLKAPVRVGIISGSNYCSLSGFIFDYSPKPFFVGTVIGKGADYIDFSTTEEIAIPDDWTVPDIFFALRNKKEERLHFFSTGYTQLSKNEYRFHVRSDSTDRIAQAVMGEEFILPMPGASHRCGNAFTIHKSENIHVSNVQIYSLPEFGFVIRGNEGSLSFTNISFRPEPGSPIYLVCWRDGFHVKDNSGQIIWDQCDLGPLGDDAYNLSAICMKPSAINDAKDTFALVPADSGDSLIARPSLQVGDEFVAYNNFTGELIGTGRIAKIIQTKKVVFQTDAPLEKVDKNTYFCFYRYANPNYIIKNSTIEGTVRTRCPGTFENCIFTVFWIKVENERFFEGPIPKNITFKDCVFQSITGHGTDIVQIGTRYSDDVTAPAQYKCKNIVFQGCTWIGGAGYAVEPGNEVIVK